MMRSDPNPSSQIRTQQTAQGQTEVHVLEFPPSVPQYLIDELLRHPQWSFMYNDTLLEINDFMAEMVPVATTPPPHHQQQQRQRRPRPQHHIHQQQQQQHQPQQHHHQQQQQQQQHFQQNDQFQTLPVQSVQPGVIQGQGVQVAHLPGVQVEIQGVSVDHAGPAQGHISGQNFGRGQITSHSQNINQQRGMGQSNQMVQGQGQINTNFQNFQNQGQQQGHIIQTQRRGLAIDRTGSAFQLDPYSAVNGNIQVEPVQSFNIGHSNNMHTGQVDIGHQRVATTRQFQGQPGQQNLQIVSAREMNFLPWK